MIRLLFDWEYGVPDRIVCCMDAVSAKGVGDRNGRSVVGVVNGEVKATFLYTSIVMVVVIIAAASIVAFEALLEDEHEGKRESVSRS